MNIGLILPHIGASQLAFYGINQCHLAQQVTNDSIFLFLEELRPPCLNAMVSCMNVCEIFSFKGVMISTNLSNTLMSLGAPNGCKKIFYVWDLEFLRKDKNNFIVNNRVYRDPQLKIVCRSQDHAQAFENYTNRKPDAIVQNLNIIEIMNALNIELNFNS